MQQLWLRPFRRLPISFGWLTKRGDAATARRLKPLLQQQDIRRDAVKTLRAFGKQKSILLDAANHLSGSDRSALDQPARLAELVREFTHPPGDGQG